MFAGPNGSGKSTLNGVINKELLGVYINPDEIEKEIKKFDFLDMTAYHVKTNKEEVLTFFEKMSISSRLFSFSSASFLYFRN